MPAESRTRCRLLVALMTSSEMRKPRAQLECGANRFMSAKARRLTASTGEKVRVSVTPLMRLVSSLRPRHSTPMRAPRPPELIDAVPST